MKQGITPHNVLATLTGPLIYEFDFLNHKLSIQLPCYIKYFTLKLENNFFLYSILVQN